MALFLAFFGFSACQKDESALNDYDLFGRLQFAGGTWELIAYQSYDNSLPNPAITITTPTERVLYHFYMQTIQVSGTLIDKPVVCIYNGETLSQVFDAEAEKERVVFRAGEIFGGTVYTVLSNAYNKQIWQNTTGSLTTQYTLERCNCEIPVPTSTETGG